MVQTASHRYLMKFQPYKMLDTLIWLNQSFYCHSNFNLFSASFRFWSNHFVKIASIHLSYSLIYNPATSGPRLSYKLWIQYHDRSLSVENWPLLAICNKLTQIQMDLWHYACWSGSSNLVIQAFEELSSQTN